MDAQIYGREAEFTVTWTVLREDFKSVSYFNLLVQTLNMYQFIWSIYEMNDAHTIIYLT